MIIYLYFLDLFEKVPNTLSFYSPSCHLSFEVIREEGQILLFYLIVME